ncbi:MAG TPA: hypothetical protein QGF41_14285, partial [Gammaproteobacteria bacterium]|nr:hypothetical protein [Gammaproteobacteria bacterium]
LVSILGLLSLTILLVILARASVIYSLVPITVRLLKLPAITWAERHIMWWGGLKGGLAIANRQHLYSAHSLIHYCPPPKENRI